MHRCVALIIALLAHTGTAAPHAVAAPYLVKLKDGLQFAEQHAHHSFVGSLADVKITHNFTIGTLEAYAVEIKSGTGLAAISARPEVEIVEPDIALYMKSVTPSPRKPGCVVSPSRFSVHNAE